MSVDLITCYGSLPQFQSQADTLKEAQRLLRPSGFLFIKGEEQTVPLAGLKAELVEKMRFKHIGDSYGTDTNVYHSLFQKGTKTFTRHRTVESKMVVAGKEYVYFKARPSS